MFKMQIDKGDNDRWEDVKGGDNRALTFATSAEAHRKLEELFPVLVKTQKYVGPERTRVVAIIEDED